MEQHYHFSDASWRINKPRQSILLASPYSPGEAATLIPHHLTLHNHSSRLINSVLLKHVFHKPMCRGDYRAGHNVARWTWYCGEDSQLLQHSNNMPLEHMEASFWFSLCAIQGLKETIAVYPPLLVCAVSIRHSQSTHWYSQTWVA